MKYCVFLATLFFSGACFSVEFDNAVGFGIQYGGLLGWQGSASSDKLHGRIAIGLVGVAAGVDINVNEYVSLGATVGGIGFAAFKSINLNYYPEGKYTEGWRMGLDAGTADTTFFVKDKSNFVSISVGYSFK